MKSRTVMSKWIYPMMWVAVMGVIASCNNRNNEEDDTYPNGNDTSNNDAAGTPVDEQDHTFLTEATDINLEEITLGELAMDRASREEVKELGKMMHEDHLDLLDEIRDLSNEKDITIPTDLSPKAQEAYDRLKDKTGNEFDRAYCDLMVEGHRKAIEKFENAINQVEDKEIKNWAENTLPGLRKHLEHSIKCQLKLESQ